MTRRVFLSMAGLASGASANLSHTIGHALGTYAGVPHGQTSCVLLPAVMRWLADTIPECQRMVCKAMGRPGHDAGEALESLIAQLRLPSRLSQIGVAKELLATVAERTMHDPLVANCRKPVTSADVREILAMAY